MAFLLSLETTTHLFSCSLHQDQRLIAYKESVRELTTASMLAVLVESLFKDSGLSTKQLNAVVVASGPGSYTGLRIGVATAKGICYALDIPLISANSLSLIAQQFIDQYTESACMNDVLLCPMLDARRMEVYCMLCDCKGNIVEPIQAKVIDEKSFSTWLRQKVIYFFGEGSDKCKNTIHHSNAKFITGIKPSAASLGIMGLKKYLSEDFEKPEFFEPLYLKDFVIKKPNLIS